VCVCACADRRADEWRGGREGRWAGGREGRRAGGRGGLIEKGLGQDKRIATFKNLETGAETTHTFDAMHVTPYMSPPEEVLHPKPETLNLGCNARHSLTCYRQERYERARERESERARELERERERARARARARARERRELVDWQVRARACVHVRQTEGLVRV
jgi:hypothetical protein